MSHLDFMITQPCCQMSQTNFMITSTLAFNVTLGFYDHSNLGVKSLDLHGGEEDVEEADHDNGEVEEVPSVPVQDLNFYEISKGTVSRESSTYSCIEI